MMQYNSLVSGHQGVEVVIGGFGVAGVEVVIRALSWSSGVWGGHQGVEVIIREFGVVIREF